MAQNVPMAMRLQLNMHKLLENTAQSDLEPMAAGESQATTRDDASGIVKGYMVKTAQSLSMLQRKHFFKRWYELNL